MRKKLPLLSPKVAVSLKCSAIYRTRKKHHQMEQQLGDSKIVGNLNPFPTE